MQKQTNNNKTPTLRAPESAQKASRFGREVEARRKILAQVRFILGGLS